MKWRFLAGAVVALLAAPAPSMASAQGVTSTAQSFANTPLIQPNGNSEPGLAIGGDGSVVVDALRWIRNSQSDFVTDIWKGPFGSVPAFQGPIDASLKSGVGGGGDADVDIGSTGTLHATTLIFFFNPVTRITQLGVSAITCPNADTSSHFANCTAQILDNATADRNWVTSDGRHVWISFHDPFQATLIHVDRSDDDGFTFRRVGDPVVGQGGSTADATFNNTQGPIVADPTSHTVYDIYAAGQPGIQKATTTNFNNIFVSRSTDLGQTWTPTLVFSGPFNVAENNVFPTLAVDPETGRVFAAWSDAHHVFFSMSADHGATWSTAVAVNVSPATTAVFPWLAARSGTVDLVYYGTTAASKDDPTAVWNVYLAQSTDGGAHFTQVRVSDQPNHVGVICTHGTACKPGTRNLLDLFKVAIDPQNRKAAIAYASDTLTTDASGNPLPQAVLAQQT